MHSDSVLSLKHWLNVLKPHQKELTIGIALQLVSTLSVLFVPSLLGYVSMAIINPTSSQQFDTKVIFMVIMGLLLLRAVFQFMGGVLLGSVHEKVIVDLQTSLYNHAQYLPLNWFNERKHGDLMAVINRDTSYLAGFIAGSLPLLVPALFLFLAVMVMMMRIDFLLGCAVVLLLPFFYLLSKLVGKKIKRLSEQLLKNYGQAVAIADENLSRVADIKAYNREGYETQRFKKRMADVLSQSLSVVRLNAALGPVIQLMAASGIVGLVWLTGQQVMVGAITPAQQFSFLLYGLLLSQPVSMLATVYGRMQLALAAAKRLDDILAHPVESMDAQQTLIAPIRGELVFDNVVFSYPEHKAVLEGLDLCVKPGETIAITGKNGAGKSTLVHLLLRFYEPDSGRILLDGVEISRLSIHRLRDQIGLVSQNVRLINGSIRDNIRYGKEGAADGEINQAIDWAGLGKFINQLPQQADTQVGDNGVKLSGGQKQRIALARCLLKNASIIILDEATAMFDPKGEADFIEKATHHLHDKTVIIITHRTASLALADHIVTLEAGKISPVAE